MSREIFHSGKNISIGDRIKILRGELNQGEFGKIIGVEAPAISKYEKGRKPKVAILEKIADYGQVTIEWLLRGDAPEPAAEIPEIPEAITIESPPPGAGAGLRDPYLFTGIDIGALTQIIELVEDHLLRRKRPLKPVKKALLFSLLYDEFHKSGHPPDQPTLLEFLRKVE
jgi:transcriptional regulator with XRE-family HTH domain